MVKYRPAVVVTYVFLGIHEDCTALNVRIFEVLAGSSYKKP